MLGSGEHNLADVEGSSLLRAIQGLLNVAGHVVSEMARSRGSI